MAKVTFFDSAIGKTVKVAFWSGISAFLAVVLASVPNWNLPANVAFLVPLINTILMLIKQLADKNVPNFPTK